MRGASSIQARGFLRGCRTSRPMIAEEFRLSFQWGAWEMPIISWATLA